MEVGSILTVNRLGDGPSSTEVFHACKIMDHGNGGRNWGPGGTILIQSYSNLLKIINNELIPIFII